MKNVLLLLLFPLMIFAQDSPLVGDVDCDGEVNSQDASLILQFVTGVIDELPCQDNMTGLTPEQLQEMIDMMDEQLSINYTAGSGGGCDYRFPEGLGGDVITHDLINFNDYTVPSGKKLYILQHYATDNTARIRIDGLPIILGINNTLANPIVASSGQIISNGEDNQSVFNGFIVEETNDVQAITHDLINFNDYTVPSGKKLYILQHYATESEARIRIDGLPIVQGTNYFDNTLANPIVASSGQVISNGEDSQSVFNGYLVDEDYFADCSGGGGSTTNSVAETGGSGSDIHFPDGLNGEPVVWYLSQGDYTVPMGKNLYITEQKSPGPSDYLIDGMLNGDLRVIKGSPVALPEGTVISQDVNSDIYFNGFIIDKQVDVVYIDVSQSYTVPDNKILYAYHWYSTGIYINGIDEANIVNPPDEGLPAIFPAGTTFDHPQFSVYLNGYLVDEDYFSLAGSGSTSNASDGTMSVSTFGDTLTLNGESVIVPGLSFSNIAPSFGTVTDLDGNVYQTVIHGDIEIMAENLKVTKFNNGDEIPEICYCGTNTNSMCSEPAWTYYGCDENNLEYGRLYIGYVIQDDRNICPEGWSIPDASVWQQLFDLFINQPYNSINVNMSAILEDGTNESGLSIKLGGSQGPGGVGWENGMGQFESIWYKYGDFNIFSNSVSEYFQVSPDNNVNAIGGYDYRYCRCVKD